MSDIETLTLTFQTDGILYSMREKNLDSMEFNDRLWFLKRSHHSNLNVRDSVNAYVAIRMAACNTLEYWNKTNAN
jgi:hypothetical protein